jgi:uncharacterized membrane protein
MNKPRLILFGSVVAAAMVFGGLMGATVFAHSSGVAPAFAALAAASPSPTFKSNEDATHEKNESAAQEAAENNGTFRPGAGGHPCGGHSNEDAAHEKTETAAQEAAENAACPSPPASSASGG